MERIQNLLSQYWRPLLASVGALAVLVLLLVSNLGGLTSQKFAATELATQQSSASLHSILEHPVGAPYKIAYWLAIKLGFDGLITGRFIAAMFAILAVVLFYIIVRSWYSVRVAAISTLLFAGSAGMLHFGRYGTADVLQFFSLGLIAGTIFYQRAKNEILALYVFATLLAVCIYIPGLIWLELAGFLAMRHPFSKAWDRTSSKHRILAILLVMCLTTPLIVASVNNISILRDTIGLPVTLFSPLQYAKEVLHTVLSVVFRGYWPAEYWLYSAPLLSIAEVVLAIAGVALLLARPILRSNYFLLSALIVGIFLVSLHGSVTMAFLVPLLYLGIAGGIFYMLDQWLTVFPRNPVARFNGVLLIGVLVTFIFLYQTRAYFIAWPNAPETRAVYLIRQD